MGVYSGRFGMLLGIAAIRNWQVNDEHNPAVFANSATAIGHGRRRGVSSWAGSYSNHGAQPPLFPGQFATFEGYTAPDSGILDGTGNNYTGQIICDSVGIAWDWTGGQVLSSQSQFSGTGVLGYDTSDHITDASLSDPEPILPCKVQYQAVSGGAFSTLACITQANLNITSANVPYVNSSTSGTTGRAAGLIDWSASINIEDDALYSGLVKGNSYIWRFFTTATKYYELAAGIVVNAGNLNVNPETGAIISYTMNLAMDGMYDVSGTSTKGHIKLPDLSTYWG